MSSRPTRSSPPEPTASPSPFVSSPDSSQNGAVASDDNDSDSNKDHARSIDTVAAAAAEVFNNHNVHTNSTIKLSSAAAPVASRITASPTGLETPTSSSVATSTPNSSSSNIQFRSQTIAPSPPPPRSEPSTTLSQRASQFRPSNLHLDPSLPTDIHPAACSTASASHGSLVTPTKAGRPSLSLQRKTSASSLKPISRTPSLKNGSLHGIFGPASTTSSAYPSPVISAMGDVTPLPSPLLDCDSPGPWKKLGRISSRDGPQHAGESGPPGSPDPVMSTPSKRKPYPGLPTAKPVEGAISVTKPQQNGDHKPAAQTHTRNRSISDYIPDPMLIPKRMVTVSGSHVKSDLKDVETGFEPHMRREPHLSEARGLTPIEKPPTPPPSESSLSTTDALSAPGSGSSARRSRKASQAEYFEAYGRHDQKRRRWRALKMLGQGTFSRVMLATSQISPTSDDDDYPTTTAAAASGLHTPEPAPQYERRTLVAVKVCEHGPKGGASEDRIEMSLKRELEIMKSIHHPSLVHLKAWNIEPTRAILVLSYCPGGDLFDVASGHREVLSPGLLRRIFAELVGAVMYLHDQKIVHRDIKLENVLVNLPTAELCSTTTDWTTYPYSVITLTDLGLSRRIADDERLETRCGSDDYAAPEVIMGQPYDGRATDAWSLGVLLYALLESRLPFDPHPAVGDYAMQMRMRSRTSHRIARVEWRWIEYGVRDGEGDGDGDHEADLKRFDAKGLRGAMEVVEGLLKRARSRWPMSKVAEAEWVSGGIKVEGGIKFREEEEGEEVL